MQFPPADLLVDTGERHLRVGPVVDRPERVDHHVEAFTPIRLFHDAGQAVATEGERLPARRVQVTQVVTDIRGQPWPIGQFEPGFPITVEPQPVACGTGDRTP